MPPMNRPIDDHVVGHATPVHYFDSVAMIDNSNHVGTVANMRAELITRFRDIAVDGTGIEMVVWKVPEPSVPATHGYKYRLVYVESGVRVVGFDNERGKGDHKHVGGEERPYVFVERLIEDFITEVEKWKSGR